MYLFFQFYKYNFVLVMIPYDQVIRSVKQVIEKVDVPDDYKEKLEKATTSVISKLMPYQKEICFENILLASLYIGSREIGMPLNPLQVNEAGSGYPSTAWLKLLDTYYSLAD